MGYIETDDRLLTCVDVTQPVLATLTDPNVSAATKAALNSTLGAALTTQLKNASASAGYADLAILLPAVDVVDSTRTLKHPMSRQFIGPSVTDASQVIITGKIDREVTNSQELHGASGDNPLLSVPLLENSISDCSSEF